jgi:hypothetical protein
LAQVVRIRPFDPSLPPEYCTTFNVSRDGLYFVTSAAHYAPGVNVYITCDYQPGSPLNHAISGVVVRVEKRDDENWGIAVHIFSPSAASVQ